MAFFDPDFLTPLANPRASNDSSNRIPDIGPFPSDLSTDPGPIAPPHSLVTPAAPDNDSVVETLLNPPLPQISNSRPSSASQSSIWHVDYYASIDFPPKHSSLIDPAKILSSIPPVDWCDAFSLPFHLELACNPLKYLLLESSFESLSEEDSIHSWLAMKIKSNPIALLFSHQNHSPGIIHNITLNPDSGTFSNPKIEIWALDRSSFDSPPLSIENSNLLRLLSSSSVPYVPTVHQILSHCVTPIPGADPLTTYAFKFDPSLFEIQIPSSSDYADPIANTFDCCSFLLLPPRISGEMISFLDPKGKSPALRISSFGSLCSELYRSAALYWWIDPSRSPQEKASGMPSDDPYFLPYHSSLQFLWVLHHAHDAVHSFIPARPDDFDSALSHFRDHKKKLFPSLPSQNPASRI